MTHTGQRTRDLATEARRLLELWMTKAQQSWRVGLAAHSPVLLQRHIDTLDRIIAGELQGDEAIAQLDHITRCVCEEVAIYDTRLAARLAIDDPGAPATRH